MTEARRSAVAHVCVTCRREGDDPAAPRAGARLLAALEASAPGGLALAPVECLGNCKRGCSVALAAEGTWTYVFGDLGPDAAPDILTAAALLAASPDGLMPWRGRPEPFKRGMIARIPPRPMKDAAD
jgi:predicted metal-binding protein